MSSTVLESITEPQMRFCDFLSFSTTGKHNSSLEDMLSLLEIDHFANTNTLNIAEKGKKRCIASFNISKAISDKFTYDSLTLVELVRKERHDSFCSGTAAQVGHENSSFSSSSDELFVRQ